MEKKYIYVCIRTHRHTHIHKHTEIVSTKFIINYSLRRIKYKVSILLVVYITFFFQQISYK